MDGIFERPLKRDFFQGGTPFVTLSFLLLPFPLTFLKMDVVAGASAKIEGPLKMEDRSCSRKKLF
jgi:hypothetical protein